MGMAGGFNRPLIFVPRAAARLRHVLYFPVAQHLVRVKLARAPTVHGVPTGDEVRGFMRGLTGAED